MSGQIHTLFTLPSGKELVIHYGYQVYCVEFAIGRIGLEEMFLVFSYFPYLCQPVSPFYIIADGNISS
jgi:hypothetical protein